MSVWQILVMVWCSLFGFWLLLHGVGWVRRIIRKRRASRPPAWRSQAPAAGVAPLLRADEPATSLPPVRRCRRFECAKLFVSGDLGTKARDAFLMHVERCLACRDEFQRLMDAWQNANKCEWKLDVQPYRDQKLSLDELERFESHATICDMCGDAVEEGEELRENNLEELEEAYRLPYPMKSKRTP